MLDEEIEMLGKMAVALNILESCQDFAPLIPEVRTNLVFARREAKTRFEVLGIEAVIAPPGMARRGLWEIARMGGLT